MIPTYGQTRQSGPPGSDTRGDEGVVLHEFLHLIERKHDDRYMVMMEQHMPDWRSRRDELNRLI
ncbi:DUF45 domain-containing protein [Candidatus Uhrbacteria bacterium]|nr:DUF45 domain-containing protein [Candidatus Uhrbacteria bacterium]